ncbi:Zn-dependent protease [Elusimicrobium minutum Pei191]|uniref:Zn-dependent protease n=1 Tax=Elusimicrobium minutum (strain Pei191) TaxID=445932 RepID=B2KE29_ELUMP|nr:site-2 protease family protein [Elusimicrobium minutum]ACC98775.1 Zn-dependent protease [Elusimicrobium minutum Pei191]
MNLNWIAFPILFLSIVLHEVAHGYTAFKRGDDTAYHLGRLTLNPIPHVDPVGSIIIPLLCYFSGMPVFGWAKPVPINMARLEHPNSDMGKVSLAGPMTNVLIALIAALALKIALITTNNFTSVGPQHAQLAGIFVLTMFLFMQINIMLAVFNMMPILPLDGGRVLMSILPHNLQLKYGHTERYGMMVVIIFIVIGGARFIVWPIAGLILKLIEISFGLQPVFGLLR